MGSHIFEILWLRKYLYLGIIKKVCEFILGWRTYYAKYKVDVQTESGSKLHLAKVIKLGSLIGHTINYSGVGILGG